MSSTPEIKENTEDNYSGSESDDLKVSRPWLNNNTNSNGDLIIFNFPLFFGAGVIKFSFPQDYDLKIADSLSIVFCIFVMTMSVYTFFPLIATTCLAISIVSTLTKMHNFYFYRSKGLCNCKMIWMAALYCVCIEIFIFLIFVGIGCILKSPALTSTVFG